MNDSFLPSNTLETLINFDVKIHVQYSRFLPPIANIYMNFADLYVHWNNTVVVVVPAAKNYLYM